jgi:hypothetical protein
VVVADRRLGRLKWAESAPSGVTLGRTAVRAKRSALEDRLETEGELPLTAHWGIEDPAAVEGTDIEKERAFKHGVPVSEEPHLGLHEPADPEP